MTRIDSVRAATDTAKESVLHAAEVVAPYAGTARHQATHYAHEARVKLAPKVSQAAQQARTTARAQYGALQPRIEQARGQLPPKVDLAAQKAVVRAQRTARQAADYAVPRVEQAMADAIAAAEPARAEAAARSAAAVAAIRGQVTSAEIQKLVRKRERRARNGRAAKRLLVLGALAGAAVAAWKWWDKQANPDWLVEPPAATELGERAPFASADGTEQAELDAELQSHQTGVADGEAGTGSAAESDEKR
ncbi:MULTISPECIES: DUF5324 family protein [Streptomyces]|uniref:Transcriptional regulator n=2 Tax=Streptomyces TaxID=1883 RepID=A0A3R7F5L6_9ACTN|nr:MULTISPECIES: DUF5324 family protein [Streptomyces]KNE82537.1 nosiheptide resistance regulatory protein [Streptomyces fradiae]OFA52007.1 transcriptional regulator [Streptomyces fradiae]PQM23095.1 transcriptional regulator [Streptomyces xinghaiensis]RKM91460.1 transcriptional regulator [Streptomyces xinghaiensis]RNC74903.1 transcriptional regulator [Streptomyces xinghaiensis]